MRAVVLAAGEGSRLRPLTATQPKVMLPVANRPILEHVVEALVDNDVTDLTLVVGYRRERVQSHFDDGEAFGCEITYTLQDQLLGTAHALAQAPESDEETVVIGGDNVVGAELVGDLLDAPEGPALAVHDSETPSKYGVVRLEGDRVVDILEKPALSEPSLVSTGVYRFPPSFHRTVREQVKSGRTGLSAVLAHEIDEGTVVRAVRSDGLWMDALYPWDILELNASMQAMRDDDRPRDARIHEDATVDGLVGDGGAVAAGAVVGPDCSLGDGVSVGAGAVLENCVVYDDARIGPGSTLCDTVVGEGADLGARTTCPTGRSDVKATDGYHEVEGFGAVVAEDARIGGGATLAPGVLVGARARIGVGATVRRNVPVEGEVM